MNKSSWRWIGGLWAVWASLVPLPVLSTPYIMLKNAGNKCFKVDVTTDMVLLVDFEAPDLVMGDRRADEEEPPLGEEGLDSRFNQRDRRKVRQGRVRNRMMG